MELYSWVDSPMTTVALVKMGVGSGESYPNDNIFSVSDSVFPLYFSSFESRVVKGFDGTINPSISSEWNAGEIHAKIVQVSTDGTQFRVGNRRYEADGTPIDANIVWSSWAAYDGSFDPLDYIRFGYGITVPIGLHQFQQWNKVATGEEILELVGRAL